MFQSELECNGDIRIRVLKEEDSHLACFFKGCVDWSKRNRIMIYIVYLDLRKGLNTLSIYYFWEVI